MFHRYSLDEDEVRRLPARSGAVPRRGMGPVALEAVALLGFHFGGCGGCAVAVGSPRGSASKLSVVKVVCICK